MMVSFFMNVEQGIFATLPDYALAHVFTSDDRASIVHRQNQSPDEPCAFDPLHHREFQS